MDGYPLPRGERKSKARSSSCSLVGRGKKGKERKRGIMQCVILAGGLATRMRPMTAGIAKSMIKIEGRPFLEYQLDWLREHQIKEIVLCIGHLGWQIRRYFGNGNNLGMNIRYSDEKDGLLGTGGALKNAEKLLADEFFLLYGDSYLPIDFGAVASYFRKFQKKSLMVVYENQDKFDKSNIEIEENLVKSYDKKNNQGMLYIDAGVSVLRREVLKLAPSKQDFPLEGLYQMLIKEKEMLAYQAKQRFYQIGSFQGLEEFKNLVEGILPSDNFGMNFVIPAKAGIQKEKTITKTGFRIKCGMTGETEDDPDGLPAVNRMSGVAPDITQRN
jgi:N-acetyl-alpha-D-muramate 1-phosphate uridylyltransferase